jgi:hypothetical protein
VSDPITHTINASPWIVASLTASASFLFDLPLGVVITAAGGAYWAVYRDQSLSIVKSIFLIIAGMAIASIMVDGASWLFSAILGLTNIPQRPLAFILGFAVIDKAFRDKIIDYVKSRLDGLEVKR